MPLVSMTEEEVVLFRQMMDWFKHRALNERRLQEYEPEPWAPETYVAKTPLQGIPGRQQTPGTGTGSSEADEPGSALCQIYRLHQMRLPDEAPGSYYSQTGELRYTGFTRRVYNLSEAEIDPDIYILVTRDKWGKWWLVNSGNCVNFNEIDVPWSWTFNPATCTISISTVRTITGCFTIGAAHAP